MENKDIAALALLFLGILSALGCIILLFCKRWDRKHVSFSFASLLLADTLQLIASPFIVETVLRGVPCWHASWWCTTVHILFSVSVFCGLFSHLLVVLENLCSERQSLVVSIVSGFVWVHISVLICAVYLPTLKESHLFIFNISIGVAALFIAVGACVSTFRTLPKFNSTTAKCQRLKVLAVGMFTFVILYVPNFLYGIIQAFTLAWTEGLGYVVFLPCLRPITDYVLYCFFCKDTERPKTQKTTDMELK